MQTKNAVVILFVCILVTIGFLSASHRREKLPTDWQQPTWTPQPRPIEQPVRPDTPVAAKQTLIYFGAPWCHYCQNMMTEIGRPNVKSTIEKQFIFRYVNVDEQPAMAQRYGVTTVPAYRIVDSTGNVLKSGEGYKSGKDFLTWLGVPKERPKMLGIMRR